MERNRVTTRYCCAAQLEKVCRALFYFIRDTSLHPARQQPQTENQHKSVASPGG